MRKARFTEHQMLLVGDDGLHHEFFMHYPVALEANPPIFVTALVL